MGAPPGSGTAGYGAYLGTVPDMTGAPGGVRLGRRPRGQPGREGGPQR